MFRVTSYSITLTLVLLSTACGTSRRSSGPADAGPSIDTAVPEVRPDALVRADTDTLTDSGSGDSRVPDSGAVDSSPLDSGVRDSGAVDSGPPDSGPPDSGPPDSGPPDSGPPDSGPGTDTIDSIQRGMIGAGTFVRVEGVVSGAYSDGIWVQDPGGGAYSGIKAFGPALGIRVGRRVRVTGSVLEYFNDTEIDMATITDLGAAPALTPTRVTVLQAASEAYEGVLVRLTDTSSSTLFYDCTLDNPSCTDTDLWQVSSFSASIVVSPYTYESFDWSGRTGSLEVVGVLSYRYDGRRVMPRTSADL